VWPCDGLHLLHLIQRSENTPKSFMLLNPGKIDVNLMGHLIMTNINLFSSKSRFLLTQNNISWLLPDLEEFFSPIISWPGATLLQTHSKREWKVPCPARKSTCPGRLDGTFCEPLLRALLNDSLMQFLVCGFLSDIIDHKLKCKKQKL